MNATPPKKTTPSNRKLRPNSNTTLTLKDVKDLIENMRSDIICDIRKRKLSKDDTHVQDTVKDLHKRIKLLESTNIELREEIASMKEKVNVMEQTQQLLLQKNVSLKEDVEKMKTFSSELEDKNSLLKEEIKFETLKNAQNETLSTTIDEVQLRSIKQSNLIIFGVPESPNGTLQERIEHDHAFCQQMLNKLGLNESLDPPHRFGKIKPGQARPLRLKCKSLRQKNNILRASKSLREIPECRSIFVNPDKTPLQQENDRKLREEWRTLKNAGEDVVIFRGRVMKRDQKQNFLRRF